MDKHVFKFWDRLTRKTHESGLNGVDAPGLEDTNPILDETMPQDGTVKRIVNSFKKKEGYRTIRSLAADLNLTPTEVKSALNLNKDYFILVSFTSTAGEPLYYLKQNLQ